MVNPLMLKMAYSLRITDYHACKLSVAVLSNVVKLDIVSIAGCGENEQCNFDAFVQLSRLQVLKIDKYRLVKPLVLPSTVTSVKLRNLDCVDKVHLIDDMTSLKSLTKLGMRVTSGSVARMRDSSPPNLVSLKLSLGGDVLPLLPPTLTELKLVSKVVNICWVVEACPRLVSLHIDGGAAIHRQVPEGLHRLVVSSGFVHTSNCGSFAAVKFLPASLTRLTVRELYHEGVPDRFRLSAGDMLDVVRHVAPVLSFKDTAVLCLAVLRAYRSILSQFELFSYLCDILCRHCTVKESARKYLERVMHAGGEYWSDHFCLHQACYALEAGFPVDDILRLVGRRKLPGFLPRTETGLTEYVRHVPTLLENGWVRSLHLNGVIRLGSFTTTAILNLTTIYLGSSPTDLIVLSLLLEAHELPCLTVINMLQVKGQESLHHALLAICKYKKRMPRLETFEYSFSPTQFNDLYPSAHACERVASELNWFLCDGNHLHVRTMRYYVGSKSARHKSWLRPMRELEGLDA
jgi:hypothetical protein